MPRRRRYGYSSSRLRWKRDTEGGGLEFNELDRAEFLDFVLIAYTGADGPADDVATVVERRIAIFYKDKLPEDPYAPKDAAQYMYGEYEGLSEAEIDEAMDLTKERDEDALKHRNESDDLMKKKDTPYYGTIEKVTFEQFLDAVSRVKTDDEDDQAWDIIDQWRTRKLRSEERVI